MQKFLEMVRQSKLLAPNLKEMTIKYYTGNQHKGNSVARCVLLTCIGKVSFVGDRRACSQHPRPFPKPASFSFVVQRSRARPFAGAAVDEPQRCDLLARDQGARDASDRI